MNAKNLKEVLRKSLKTDLKKCANVGLLAIFALVSALSASTAKADSGNDHNHNRSKVPKLYTIREKTVSSVVLPIRARRFKNQTTTAIVSIKDRETKMIMEKAFKVSFDNRGNGSIIIKGLKSGTRYTFKVRLMRMGTDKTTRNSDSKTVRTD